MASSEAARALASFLDALDGAAVVYSRDKKIVASNDSGRHLIASLTEDESRYWTFADVSIDVLLHRVLDGDDSAASEIATIEESTTRVEVRASRLGFSPGEQHALLTVRELHSEATRDHSALRSYAVRRILPGAVHEVRGPLTAISGVAQILSSSTDLAADPRRSLDLLQGQVVRVDHILRNLTTFSRGPRETETLPASLNDVLRRCLDLVAYEIRAKRVVLEEDLDSDLPLLAADPESAALAVLTLLLAAIDQEDDRLTHGKLIVRTRSNPDNVASLEVEAWPRPDAAKEHALKPSPSMDVLTNLYESVGGQIEMKELFPGMRLTATLPGYPCENQKVLSDAVTPTRLLAADPDLNHLLRCQALAKALQIDATLASSSEVAAIRLAGRPNTVALLHPDITGQLDRALLPAHTIVCAAPGFEDEARAMAQSLGVAWTRQDESGAVLKSLF